VLRQRVRLAQLRRGVARAGEGEDVLPREVSQQVLRRAAHERERALGQHARGDPQLRDAVRHQRGGRRGLGDDGHPREQRHGQLLGHAPRREVEGVDVHRDAFARHQDVLTEQPRRAAHRHALAIDHQARGAQLRAELRVEHQRGRGPVDVELRVRARVAGVGDAQRDELFARVTDDLRELGEHFTARRERHRAQGGAAALARKRHRGAEVEAFRRGRRDLLFGRRVDQRRGFSVAGLPASTEVTLQVLRHGRATYIKW
jgi:hypothetical protein